MAMLVFESSGLEIRVPTVVHHGYWTKINDGQIQLGKLIKIVHLKTFKRKV